MFYPYRKHHFIVCHIWGFKWLLSERPLIHLVTKVLGLHKNLWKRKRWWFKRHYGWFKSWQIFFSLLPILVPMSHFYTPWKRQKTYGFRTFSGGIEMWRWTKNGLNICGPNNPSFYWLLPANLLLSDLLILYWEKQKALCHQFYLTKHKYHKYK